MAEMILTGHVYLLVRERQHGGYSGNHLVVGAHHKRPAPGPGEYVLPLKLAVPRSCLTHEGERVAVTVPAPEASAEPGA
jgi:hypothetical protein